MPQVNHYEAEVTLRFKVDGPLAHHEAVRAVEARASKALKGDVPAYDDPVSWAEVVSVTSDKVGAGGARPAQGGHR